MNRKYMTSIKMIALALGLGNLSLVLAAPSSPPSVSSCASVLALYNPKQPLQLPSLQNCQSSGPIISQCVQFNMASQIPSSSESLSDQLTEANNDSQILAKLDFQCHYVLSCNSQQPPCSGGVSSSGGFGSSIKNMLGIKPSSSDASSAAAPSNSAQQNQAEQLKAIQPAPSTNNKNATNSDSKDNQNNSINWF